MSSGELLGKNVEKQMEALGVLKEQGEMNYQELKEALDLSDQEMQEVIRGFRYNGLVKVTTDERGVRLYLSDW